MGRSLGVLLAALGALVAIAGVGLAFPWWFPSPPTSAPSAMVGQSRAGDVFLSGWTDRRLQRAPGESDLDFAARATEAVFRATYHCEAHERGQTLAAYLAASRAPAVDSYGYLDASILRCGYCHQRAFLLAEVLRRGGLADARAYGLNGHAVTLFDAGGYNYIADADYGVAPARFEPSTMASIPRRLYAGRVDEASLRILDAAYRTTDDDGDYMTHEWLMVLAARQLAEVREYEKLLNGAGWLCFVLGAALLGLGRLISRTVRR